MTTYSLLLIVAVAALVLIPLLWALGKLSGAVCLVAVVSGVAILATVAVAAPGRVA